MIFIPGKTHKLKKHDHGSTAPVVVPRQWEPVEAQQHRLDGGTKVTNLVTNNEGGKTKGFPHLLRLPHRSRGCPKGSRPGCVPPTSASPLSHFDYYFLTAMGGHHSYVPSLKCEMDQPTQDWFSDAVLPKRARSWFFG